MDEVWVYVFATVFYPSGEFTHGYVGCIPEWHAKDKPAFAEWKRARRKEMLADRTFDPRGWRVVFEELTADEYSELVSA